MRTGTLGAYRIDHLLGMGSSGHVYAATLMQPACGLDTGATVALKVVPRHSARSKRWLEALRRDAQLGMRIRHENVVSILDYQEVVADGEPVSLIAMEHVEAHCLFRLLREYRRVPEDRCRHLARGICKALAAIHGADAVHGHLAPSKVFITPDDIVKVSGLCSPLTGKRESSLEAEDALRGTPIYLAPEQLRGAPTDARTDLHALGLLLHELSTGTHPYRQANLLDTISFMVNRPPRRLRDLTPGLSAVFEEVVHKLLAKAPDDRFQSAADVLAVLESGELRPREEGQGPVAAACEERGAVAESTATREAQPRSAARALRPPRRPQTE